MIEQPFHNMADQAAEAPALIPPNAARNWAPNNLEVVIQDELIDHNVIHQCLFWIGFRAAANRNRIVADAFVSFGDIRMLTPKDVANMSSEFMSRTPAAQRITFGTTRTKLLVAFTHWVEDFYRCSLQPTIIGINGFEFRDQLSRALQRADVRKNIKDHTKIAAEASSPGPLENEREWKKWEERFENYARSHIGSNGVPLSYVIRRNDEPDRETDFNGLFLNQTIACAPLQGEYYQADKASVFNMIISFTTGQSSHDWVKSTVRFADGRRTMKALRDHFEGEGNATRNKAHADRLKESLHYKSERSMPFETFLTKCQQMFNIYEKEGEPMSDDAKMRFLFTKVTHTGLRGAIEALKAQQTAGADVTYTKAASHLSTAVSELPEYLSKHRNISATGTQGGGSSDIINQDGSIKTGHIPNWRNLSESDRQRVRDERKKLGIQSSGNSPERRSKSDANRVKQLQSQNKKMRRQIKSLKRSNKSGNDKGDENNEVSDGDTDAGDQFGGRAARKKQKEA